MNRIFLVILFVVGLLSMSITTKAQPTRIVSKTTKVQQTTESDNERFETALKKIGKLKNAKSNQERGEITQDASSTLTGGRSNVRAGEVKQMLDKLDSLLKLKKKEYDKAKRKRNKTQREINELKKKIDCIKVKVSEISNQELSKAALTRVNDNRVIIQEIRPESKESDALWDLGMALKDSNKISINEMLDGKKAEEDKAKEEENKAKEEFVKLCKQMGETCPECAKQNGCDEVL